MQLRIHLRMLHRESLSKFLQTAGLSLLSALMVYLAFPDVNLFPIAWVAFVPLIFAYFRGKWWHALVGFVVFGYVFYLAALIGMRHAWPQAPYIAAIYGCLLFTLVFAFCKLLRASEPFSVAVVFTVFDFIRNTLGSLSVPACDIVSTQVSMLTLLQSCDIFGYSLVAFVIFYSNAAIAHAVCGGEKSRRHLLSAIALVAILFIYGAIRSATVNLEDRRDIVCIQPNIPQNIKLMGSAKESEIVDKHIELTKFAIRQHGTKPLYLWPESVIPTGIGYNENRFLFRPASSRIRIFQLKNDITLGIGLDVHDLQKDVYYNSFLLFRDRVAMENIEFRYDKRTLMAAGEFVPLADMIPALNRLVADAMGVEKYVGFGRGTEAATFENGGTKFGVLICLEILLPNMVRELKEKGCDAIIVPSNEAWFNDSSILDQDNNVSIVRAIENRIAVIRVTNSGVSAIIDPLGQSSVLQKGGKCKSVDGILTGKVRATRSGPLLPPAFFIGILASAVVLLRFLPKKP